jgi:UDP-N-acetylmuramate dehydrogenase
MTRASTLRWEDEACLDAASTLGLRSTARHLARAADAAAVTEAVARADALGLPLHVLGGGSNVILAERIEGVVLQVEDRRCEVLAEGRQPRIRVGAGHDWHALVTRVAALGWWGMENLALIPGTVGAAPVQNIGAYGQEFAETCVGVRALRRRDGEVVFLDAPACHFAYRDSLFRRDPGAWILLEIELMLTTRGEALLSYPGVADTLGARSADRPAVVVEAVATLRRRRLPDPAIEANAGSFFKNPVLSAERFDELRSRHASLPGHEVSGGVKLPAAWLIEACGWRGRARGAFAVSDRHALVIVHRGGGAAAELFAFAKAISDDVEARFGVLLEREPIALGFDDPHTRTG